MIQGILLDLSGVLYTGNQVIPGALTALQQLRDKNLPVRYITNTTRKPSAAIIKQLTAMGFNVKLEELFTAPIAARDYLKDNRLTPYLLVHPELEEEFTTLEQGDNVNAVVVGDAAEGFSYDRMNRAFRYLLENANLVALGINRYFRDGDQLCLDAGPYIKALEYASGKTALVFGKPAHAFYMSAVDNIGCLSEATIMVGDDIESDVIGAVDAGLQGILVQTGKYRSGDETRLPGNAVCVKDIAAAVEYILYHC